MSNNNELLGIPDDPPLSTQPVGDDANLFTGEESQADQALDEALAEAADGFQWIKRVQRLLAAGPFLILLVCLVLLFMFSQTLTLLHQLHGLPDLMRYAGYGLTGLLTGGVLWALLRLFRVFAKLRVSPRIPFDTLQQLADRAELRREANARLQKARATLHSFLASYPLDDQSDAMILLGRHVDAATLKELTSNSETLLTGTGGTSEGWLERFDRQFLRTLDEAARHCIRRYASRVALKTAALPAGFDTAVILLNAYLLARDICVIYNLRTDGPGTAAVLMRVMFNAFAASQMQDVTASAMEMFFEGGGVVAGLGRAVAARAAEGSVNALLFMRLGAAMVRHLRPIWPPHK